MKVIRLLICVNALFLLVSVVVAVNAKPDDIPVVPGGSKIFIAPTNPREARCLTLQDSNQVEALIPSVATAPRPPRDEGEGELIWEGYDEYAVVGEVAFWGRDVAVGYVLNNERLEIRDGSDGQGIASYSMNADVAGLATGVLNGENVVACSAGDSLWLFGELWHRPLMTYEMGDLRAGPVAISSDGVLIATGVDLNNGTNRVWCFEDGDAEPVWTYEADANEYFSWYGVTIPAASDIVVVNGKYHLSVLDITTGEEIWDAPTYNTESPIALSDDGSVLAIASLSGWLLVYHQDDEVGYRELWRYRLTAPWGSWVSAVAVSPDGSEIAVGTLDFYEDHHDGRVALFETFAMGEPVWVSEHPADEIADIAFNADGSMIAAASWGDIDNEQPDLMVYETHNNEPFYTLTTPGSLSALAFEGSRIVAGGKSVHNRVFGAGGRLYMVEVARLAATVMGRVTDAESVEPVVGAVLSVDGSPYQALTDVIGNYVLPVQVADENPVTVRARAVGYMDGEYEDLDLRRGAVVGNINFSLTPAENAPEGLVASNRFANYIKLEWRMSDQRRIAPALCGLPLLSAVEKPQRELEILTPTGDKMPLTPRRDQPERINIYRSWLPGGLYFRVGDVGGEDTLFVDRTHLLPNREYCYAITADFGDGESAYSNEARGSLNSEWLVWEADLQAMPQPPRIDGTLEEEEWLDAESRDISDVYGYDGQDSAGSVLARIGFSDETDRLYLGVKYLVRPELTNRVGVGVYVDDDGDGRWSYERSGSEGNYWGYWVDRAPDMRYRSLSGKPNNASPYYQFADPELAFSDDSGYVTLEMAIPLGFRSPEQVALYAPDWTIGLGLFAVYRDENDAPVYNGWWPQDMLSIVSEPEQFARVHIPADIIAPPQAPAFPVLTQEAEALLLRWEDPTLGMDEGELDGFAGVNIYRNGAFITTVEPGEEHYRDSLVIHGGWYEYRAAGFVNDLNGEPFEGPASQAVGMFAGADPIVDELGYDDGTAEAYYVVSYNDLDNRFAVQFDLDEPADTTAVFWVDFYSGSADPIGISIATDDNSAPGEMIGGEWTADVDVVGGLYRFHYPDVRQPRVPIDLNGFNSVWAVLHYLDDSPSVPPVGVDQSEVDRQRNMYYLSNRGWQPFTGGRLMIRIGVGSPLETPPPEEPVNPTAFRLWQNYPNPFNGVSIVPVDLPNASELDMVLYDLNGRVVFRRALGLYPVGSHALTIGGEGLAGGLYLLQLNSNTRSGFIKLSLIK